MTNLAESIVTALFDMGSESGGLVKSRAIQRVKEVMAADAVATEAKMAAIFGEHPEHPEQAVVAYEYNGDGKTVEVIWSDTTLQAKRDALEATVYTMGTNYWTKHRALMSDITTSGSTAFAHANNTDVCRLDGGNHVWSGCRIDINGVTVHECACGAELISSTTENTSSP